MQCGCLKPLDGLVYHVKGSHVWDLRDMDVTGDKGAKGNYQPTNIPGTVCSFQALIANLVPTQQTRMANQDTQNFCIEDSMSISPRSSIPIRHAFTG